MKKRGIDVMSGFNVKSSDPIDNRIVCDTLDEMYKELAEDEGIQNKDKANQK